MKFVRQLANYHQQQNFTLVLTVTIALFVSR